LTFFRQFFKFLPKNDQFPWNSSSVSAGSKLIFQIFKASSLNFSSFHGILAKSLYRQIVRYSGEKVAQVGYKKGEMPVNLT
jgi:hypothetical protein